MTKHEFGGEWTNEKLQTLRKYLAAYTTIFTGNPKARKLTTIDVDAFAGTGYRSTRSPETIQPSLFPELSQPDTAEFLEGSARIALEIEPPFNYYLFIEQRSDFVQELVLS